MKRGVTSKLYRLYRGSAKFQCNVRLTNCIAQIGLYASGNVVAGRLGVWFSPGLVEMNCLEEVGAEGVCASVPVRLVGITALLGQTSQGRSGLVGHEHSHASDCERGVDLEAGEHPLCHMGGGCQGEVLGDDVACGG